VTIMLNAMAMMFKGEIRDVFRIVLNLIPIGQWFSNTSFADEGVTMGFFAKIALSVIVTLIFIFIGTFRLNNRDIK